LREASSLQIRLALIALIFLLFLAGSSRLLPLQSNAQSAPTVTGVGPWTQQGNYGSSSTTPGQGGIGTLGASCVVSSGDVYCVGGQNETGTDISDVFYAPLSSSGSIGPWTETTDYGATSGTSGTGGIGIEWPSCVESGGYIYCVAGATNNGIVSKVFYAQLSSSGVGPWTETTDYGASSGSTGSGGMTAFQLACVTDSGYIYCVGGGAGSKVFYAQLTSSGIGPWTETTDYGAASGSAGTGGIPVDSNACVDNAGYIYCVGGTGANYTVISDVFSAPVSSNGVGAWTENTDYGAASGSDGKGGEPVYGTSCVVYFSYIICIGGDTTGSVGTSNVFYGQDGNILGWKESEEGYVVVTYWDDCVESYGYVYCWGQDDPNVYSSPIDTPSTITSTTSPTSATSATSVSTTSTTTTSTTVVIRPTSIATSLEATPIFAGDTDFDTAFFTSSPPPSGGTITFYSYSGPGCSGTKTMIGTPVSVPQPSGSSLFNSATGMFSQPGSYYFEAYYGGDATDSPATSLCETLTVLAATSSSSSTSTSTTTPSSGSGIGTTDLLIGVGAAVVLLGAGGYLISKRGKQERPPPETTEPPPPPPRPPPPPPPPTATAAPVTPLCPEGARKEEEKNCDIVTLWLSSQAVPQIEGIYTTSSEEVQRLLDALDTAIAVSGKAAFAVGMALDPVGTLITSIASPDSQITEQFTGLATKALNGLADTLAGQRRYQGYIKVIYPKVSYRVFCVTTTECIHGRWVVTKRELRMQKQDAPTMGEWVPQGEGENLMISSLEQVKRMMATFRNSVAGPHNQQENAKVEACAKKCPPL